MRKIYILEDLECANCAGKMEEAINKIVGVNKATVTFMTRKLVLDAAEESFEEIVEEVKRIVRKIEPDVVVREK